MTRFAFVFFAVSAALVGAAYGGSGVFFKFLPYPLTLVLDRCALEVEEPFFDYAACHRADSYVAKGNITEDALIQLFDELGLVPESSTADEAVAVLSRSVGRQLKALSELGDESAGTARDRLESTQAEVVKFIRDAEKKGAEIRVDQSAQWAPSVNAVAVVLIERYKREVSVILHGDTDG